MQRKNLEIYPDHNTFMRREINVLDLQTVPFSDYIREMQTEVGKGANNCSKSIVSSKQYNQVEVESYPKKDKNIF